MGADAGPRILLTLNQMTAMFGERTEQWYQLHGKSIMCTIACRFVRSCCTTQNMPASIAIVAHANLGQPRSSVDKRSLGVDLGSSDLWIGARGPLAS
jgi:hypothetical protein